MNKDLLSAVRLPLAAIKRFAVSGLRIVSF